MSLCKHMQKIYFHLLKQKKCTHNIQNGAAFLLVHMFGHFCTLDSVHTPSIKAANIWYITFIYTLHRAFYSSVPSTMWWHTCTQYTIPLLCVHHVCFHC